MRELLAGYAAAVEERLAGDGATDRARRELEDVSAALVRYEDLRRVLVDPGVAERTRRAVLRDLLEGKARPELVDLLSYALRVERAPEVPIVFGQLLSALETAGAAAAPLPGRAAGRERLRGYAERVLQEQASAEDVEALEDELFGLARLLEDNPGLRRALADPQSPLAARQAVLDDLLRDKVGAATLRLARFVLAAGQQRDLVGAFEALAASAAEEQGRRLAEVRSAVDLDEQERSRLAAALGRLVERPVEVRVIVDPRVIGGALVTIGDLIIDGTVRLRLERLRDALARAS